MATYGANRSGGRKAQTREERQTIASWSLRSTVADIDGWLYEARIRATKAVKPKYIIIEIMTPRRWRWDRIPAVHMFKVQRVLEGFQNQRINATQLAALIDQVTGKEGKRV